MKENLIQISDVKTEVSSPQPNKRKGLIDHAFAAIRESLSIFFWFYIITKPFIFDIDAFIFEKYLPNYAWLLNFRFFILIGTLAIVWSITKNKHIFLWSLYILFYPAIIILWKIPFFLFKQKSWILAFAVVNTVISFFKSIKYNFIISAFYLVALALTFGFTNPKLLWPAILILFAILLMIYIHRLILVFKPSSIFQLQVKFFAGIRKHASTSFALEDSVKNLPIGSLDQKQLEKWTANLQASVLFNRVCLFAAKKLRDYQNSGYNFISYVLTILLLIALTIFSFSVINLGLYKINHNLFEFSAAPTFFNFIYYSFNNLIFSSIREITPISPITQTASMIESFFALFLGLIFVSLLMSVRSQRHAEELNKVIKGIEEQGVDMECFIKDEYKINSIEDAMTELQKLKAGLTKFLYKISENIK
jgi:hypothetical protein